MKSIKRILSIILTAAFLLTASTICVSAETKIVYGDVDMDGRIGLFDVLAVMKYAAKWDMSKHVPKFSIKAADVTQDGIVTTLDALKILKYIAGWGPQLLADPQA